MHPDKIDSSQLQDFENVLLNFPSGIPVAGLKKYERGEPDHVSEIRGRVVGAILTQGFSPEQFRRLARLMLKSAMAEIVDGCFRLEN